jgi:2-keto-4-pentenoate hydratase
MAERAATDRAAELLWAAWSGGELLDELPAEIRPVTPAEGWEIAALVGAQAGAAYGWKIAATSAAGQSHIGVDRPIPGRLYDRFRFGDGDVLPSAGMHMRVVEAEFAFRMAADVPAGASEAEVLGCVAALHLAIEIPDTRFVDAAAVGGPSLTADTACAGRFVLGPEVAGWEAADLAQRPTVVEINGQRAASGSGAAVLGSPVAALTWLAGDLAERGSALRAGEIVTTGTTTVPPAVGPGDEIRADFGSYGEVRLSFAR